ncbi:MULTISPECIES: hypothetical protein [Brevibacillus]|uniref:hypothetical protein n=1 Tax=Brevibacillus TaxID=55080 RepID=UPI00204072E6|nr:hypothetical protein [Brevibacillus borstelensis]MCM3470431.1 hypothetical protein [Brevibacillus borstelensis]MED2009460.1 hypothetical protein [Brevibacillus borstelensis]
MRIALKVAADMFFGAVRALVVEMNKEKTAAGSVGHCEGAELSGSIPKAKPRPKAVDTMRGLRVGR